MTVGPKESKEKSLVTIINQLEWTAGTGARATVIQQKVTLEVLDLFIQSDLNPVNAPAIGSRHS